MQDKHIIRSLTELNAKLDAILEDLGIEEVQVPEVEAGNLYNIRVPNQENMGAVPDVKATEFTQQTPAPPPLPAKNTASMDVQLEGHTVIGSGSSSLPLKDYDDMTVGEVMRFVKEQDLSIEETDSILLYEISHKDRSQVKEFLSSWKR